MKGISEGSLDFCQPLNPEKSKRVDFKCLYTTGEVILSPSAIPYSDILKKTRQYGYRS